MIKELRLAAGLTLEELGELVGVHPNETINEAQFELIQSVCNDRIKMFKGEK